MTTLNDFFHTAHSGSWAVGHFNISELDQFRAVADVCKELGSPAMIGLSEGERNHIGMRAAMALRNALREEYGIPIFLNADHTHSVDAAKEAIDAGFDSIHIDLSKMDMDENIAGTETVVAYARKQSHDISVEGEVGYLVTDSSKVYARHIAVPPESLTDPKSAQRFVERTGVDRLAPAVGSLHGIAANTPQLDIGRIKEIRAIIPDHVALVLHGGSGVRDEDITLAIRTGINNVHVSTELRVAYTHALQQSIEDDPDEVAMYKLDEAAMEAMRVVVREKLHLFGAVSRI
jgi:fructose-bisphosphate aldolase, class II